MARMPTANVGQHSSEPMQVHAIDHPRWLETLSPPRGEAGVVAAMGAGGVVDMRMQAGAAGRDADVAEVVALVG